MQHMSFPTFETKCFKILPYIILYTSVSLHMSENMST